MVTPKNNKLKKIEFVSNKPSKLWKPNFGNILSEKRLDEFAQTHFWQLNTPIVPCFMKKEL